MKKWKQKALLQKAISFLPLKHKINYFFQKYVTRGVYLSDEYFTDRLGHAVKHITAYQEYSGRQVPHNCLDLGAGWYPVVPVSLFLTGADNIYSVDISRLVSGDRLRMTLGKFIEYDNSGELENYIDCLPGRIDIVIKLFKDYDKLTTEEVLLKLKINYLVTDTRNISLPENSVDLAGSNNTFEHIYPDILIPVLKELSRIVRKDGGVMSHFIDMSDHFAHFDRSISIYNFLRFSDRQWKWIDNSVQPQNRLRIYDYKKIYSDLKIPVSAESCREGDLNELRSIPLARKFAGRPPGEIARSHCHLVSDMKNSRCENSSEV